MDMPPSRYKVVEKGRRLVVVDTQSGQAVSGADPELQSRIAAAQRSARGNMRQPDAPPPRVSPPRGAQMQRGNGARFTTDRWFDNKAPREIQLTDNAQTGLIVLGVVLVVGGLILFAMFGVFALFIGGFIVVNARKAILASITGWLDSYERE